MSPQTFHSVTVFMVYVIGWIVMIARRRSCENFREWNAVFSADFRHTVPTQCRKLTRIFLLCFLNSKLWSREIISRNQEIEKWVSKSGISRLYRESWQVWEFYTFATRIVTWAVSKNLITGNPVLSEICQEKLWIFGYWFGFQKDSKIRGHSEKK